MNITQTERGMSMTNEINPMPIVDDWAVCPTARSRSCAARTTTSIWSTPTAHDARRPRSRSTGSVCRDEDKAAVIDSAKAANGESARQPRPTAAPGAGGAQAGAEGTIVMSFSTSGDGARTSGASGALQNIPPLAFVEHQRAAGLSPGVRRARARADLDGNLWIRTTAVRAGLSVGADLRYGQRKGELVDRVQVRRADRSSDSARAAWFTCKRATTRRRGSSARTAETSPHHLALPNTSSIGTPSSASEGVRPRSFASVGAMSTERTRRSCRPA